MNTHLRALSSKGTDFPRCVCVARGHQYFGKHALQLPHLELAWNSLIKLKPSPEVNCVVPKFSEGDILPLVGNLVKLDHLNAICLS